MSLQRTPQGEAQHRGRMIRGAGFFMLVIAVVLVFSIPIAGVLLGAIAGFFLGVAGMYLDPPRGAWNQ